MQRACAGCLIVPVLQDMVQQNVVPMQMNRMPVLQNTQEYDACVAKCAHAAEYGAGACAASATELVVCATECGWAWCRATMS